jgi:thymidylate synthase (FAD)
MKFSQQLVTWGSNPNEKDCIDKVAAAMNVPYATTITDLEKSKVRISNAVRRGHTSVLEHVDLTLDCLTNVETYKDFTRHRHCAFTIESTSFVKYQELDVIVTPEIQQKYEYVNLLENIEANYKEALRLYGPKRARDLLPQSTTARMYMTTNIREWRYIIGLRGDPNDNPLTIELRDMMWQTLNSHCEFFFPACEAESALTIPMLWN